MFLPGFQKDSFDPGEKGKNIKKYLENEGWQVEISEYGNRMPMTEHLSKYGEQVKIELESFKASAIIAHSMGGLVAQEALRKTQMTIKKLIMLETPNQGIPRWALKIGILPDWSSTRCMIKNSDFLRQIRKTDERETLYYQIGGFYSVLLPKIFISPEIPTKIFKTITHSGLRSNLRVLKEILKILES